MGWSFYPHGILLRCRRPTRSTDLLTCSMTLASRSAAWQGVCETRCTEGTWSPKKNTILGRNAVDGRNPANQLRLVNIPLFTGFYTSQVVQDFFHQPSIIIVKLHLLELFYFSFNNHWHPKSSNLNRVPSFGSWNFVRVLTTPMSATQKDITSSVPSRERENISHQTGKPENHRLKSQKCRLGSGICDRFQEG